ncbi:universal stress protein [Winogradskyella psychrotolerans]|uniref:universal stress protein n=1 Tax=Winogradskyella psychrotolerans TaxID=1344585 RepID=UPI001C06603E|nr:universal stress protein [Winogradskyella psychrotolerans]MBU2927910.1 universal stress protein [Winogradskyella psychrotolerans]
MKKILLLTDFSKNATNAITYAMEFFESKTCTFYVMYVHKLGSYVSDDLLNSPKNSIHDAITDKPKKKLNALLEKLKDDTKTKDYHFELLIDYDAFTDAVNQAVKKYSIDFVVIGSNGASNVKEVIFGSNTINVVEKVNCKTLVVPSNYKFSPVKAFLVSLNKHCTLNTNLRDAIIDFIEDFELKLHVLRVTSGKETSNIALADKEQLSLLDSMYYLIEDVPVDYAVSSYLQTNNIDITAFITQDKPFLKRLFSASPSKELKSRMKLPLLVLHTH